MADNIRLITYSEQTVTPMNDAIIYDAGIGKDGILNGVEVTASGNTISITGGYGVIRGRLFQIYSSEIPVTLSSGSNLKGRLYIRLDLSNVSEPVTIQTEVADTLSELTQEFDANFTNGIFEVELATFTVTTAEVTSVKRTAQTVHGGVKIITESNTSIDEYTDAGLYFFTGDYIPTGLPSGIANGYILVLNGAIEGGKVVKQLVFRHGSDATQAQIYSRVKNTLDAWSSWARYVTENDVYYMPGNSVRLFKYGGGYLTSGGTAIFTELGLTKQIHSSVTGFTITDGKLEIRQNGKYLANSVNITSVDVTLNNRGNILQMTLTKSSGWGGTNNDAVAIYANPVVKFT